MEDIQKLKIEDQIFICKNDEQMTVTEMAVKLQAPKWLIQEQLDILKANGLYEQYKKLTDEEVAQKTDVVVPLDYKIKAESILEEYKFKKGTPGYIYWRELIALLLYKPSYRYESLAGTVYPIIIRKCKTGITSTVTLGTALRNSLISTIKEDGITIVSFLEKIGIVMKKPQSWKKKEEKDTQETKKEESVEAEIKEAESETVEKVYVKVPLKILLDYYYLKGYLDGERENEIQTKDKTDKTWKELESLYEKDKLEGK